MRSARAAAVFLFAAVSIWAALVNDVQALVASQNLPIAERLVRAAQSKEGSTSEVAAALSWLARGALNARQLPQAESYAAESRKMAMALLGPRRIDSDPYLPTAVGASIEVHAGVLAARGETAEAVTYLRTELKTWANSSIEERIQKNINLLSLEGKRGPRLEGFDLTALRGRPVLLFFWAHWCPDCKADVPIIADVARRYAPRGLALIGPTRLYGYVAGGEPAAAAVEKQYIEQVRSRYYAPLAGMPAPLSEANFQAYGASTTPTVVLLDRAGIVRFYHPGAVSEPELTARVQALLR
ncbi:MAG TPA: TlpA family protein disulfide reductase [Bryobacteraceae bacterium]|jgi:thiol-disulfide isomerase/thioredoxin|nr:TlpA family protein disulfide reductase [Bryobacteraceae bacterium]